MVSAPKKPSYSAIAPPIKAIQGIARRHISGRLLISEVEHPSVVWQLHIGDGQLHYASSLNGQRELLSYILCQFNSPIPSWITDLPGETAYASLCRAWRRENLSLFQLRNLLRLISQETLVQVISKSTVELQFKRNIGLDPIVWSSPPDDLTAPLLTRASRWRRLQPYISSPFQRLHLNEPEEFEVRFSYVVPQIQESLLTRQLLNALERCPSFYELATHLNVKVLRLARALVPAIASGVITLHPFAEETDDDRPTIMCIDDSSTVQRKVRLILESLGYRVVGLTDPLTALSSLVREKPALVFLDITMPHLDGYDLCRMLRRSPTLQEIPIVMLTGRDGLIDRVRAKVVGASGYITKPFNTQSLVDVIQKFVRQG